jgi:Protein of unknown function (DUF2752)
MTASRFADPAIPGLPLRRRETTVIAAVVGVGALVTARVIGPAEVEGGPVLCPFRLLTGLPCPGCGLTRSWVYLAHGQWQDAWAANPFGIVSMLAVAVLVIAVAVAALRRTPLPDVGRLLSSRGFLALGVVWIAYGVGRLMWTPLS